MKDAFINGLESNYIHLRLLENKLLDLATVCKHVLTLDMEENQSYSYQQMLQMLH